MYMTCLPILLVVSFAEQFKMLMKVQLINDFFMDCAFGVELVYYPHPQDYPDFSS